MADTVSSDVSTKESVPSPAIKIGPIMKGSIFSVDGGLSWQYTFPEEASRRVMSVTASDAEKRRRKRLYNLENRKAEKIVEGGMKRKNKVCKTDENKLLYARRKNQLFSALTKRFDVSGRHCKDLPLLFKVLEEKAPMIIEAMNLAKTNDVDSLIRDGVLAVPKTYTEEDITNRRNNLKKRGMTVSFEEAKDALEGVTDMEDIEMDNPEAQADLVQFLYAVANSEAKTSE